ncbi:MAG: hypothetical protein KGJ86_19990, partial [Chloroflexota bacterium]|nr:hypothetical protein [Chloroflexota bacterium]
MRGEKLPNGLPADELVQEVARAAAGESTPIDDIREYASYRKRVVEALVRQGLEAVTWRAEAAARDHRRGQARAGLRPVSPGGTRRLSG